MFFSYPFFLFVLPLLSISPSDEWTEGGELIDVIEAEMNRRTIGRLSDEKKAVQR